MLSARFNFFFTRVNPLMPCVHEGRFRTALQGPPHMRPVVCLRYVIFALVATIDDKYSKYKDVFYQRARMYIEADELKVTAPSTMTSPSDVSGPWRELHNRATCPDMDALEQLRSP
jgi:hypothetical protein